MKRVKIVFTLFLISFTTCQNTQSIKFEEIMNYKLKKTLIKQIENGCSEEYGSFDNYTIEDLEVTASLINNILMKNQYDTVNSHDFDNIISSIFHRTIDRNSNNLFLCIDKNIPCERTMKLHPLSIDYEYYYISKKYNILIEFFPLPFLIDYTKIYPELKEYEKNPIIIETNEGDVELTRWKDITDLQEQRDYNVKRLIHRNKYLFNGDPFSLIWLLKNDTEFLEQLVKVFGYDKETKINRMVLKETYKLYTETQPRNKEVLDHLFVDRDCFGQLQIREGLIKTIEGETNADQNDLFSMLNDYCFNLTSDSDSRDPNFDFKERCKIVANISKALHPVYMKYAGPGEAVWEPASVLYNIYAMRPEVIEEIIKNNYYGLNDLQTYIEDVKLDYERELSKSWREDEN